VESLSAHVLHHGAALVFLATLAARIGAPIPAAPVLVVAGALAMSSRLSWTTVIIAALLANLAGDLLWFAAGRRYGHRVLRLLCRISLSPDSCVRQSESIILRWGGVSLIAAKFVPGISVVAAPMAGALAMRWRVFLGYELLAAGLWSGSFLLLGAVFAHQVQAALALLADIGTAAVGAILMALAAFVAWRFLRRRHARLDLAVPRILADDLRRRLHAGNPAPVIVDVRSRAGVQADPRTLPNSVHMPLEELGRSRDRFAEDREVVVFCNCPNDVSAARAARLLSSQGFRRVAVLTGGLDAWFDALPEHA
jgi:membrane protein DedA with SNARE-associated domain/rhodanese-related sulfurtransferase